MANKQVILVLFYGGIWKSLSTATPLQVPVNERNAYSSSRSPREDKAPLHPRHETGPVLPQAGRALMATAAAPIPEAPPEPSDSSWVAALIIGIVLTSMLIAILIIVLWKCCKRPVPVDSNWAGRSPFADGDTPDVFTDPDQATKRSSVLFMLPWKLKQDTNLQQDPTAAEKAPGCGSSKESGAGCSGASAARPSTDPPPCSEPPTGAPCSEPLTGAPCSEPPTGPPCSEPPTGAPCSEPPTGAPCSEPLTGAPCSEPPTGPPCSEPPTGAPCSEPPTGAPCSEPPTGAPCSEPPTGAPCSEPPTWAPSSCAPPVAPPGSPELPPPPDWLRDPTEDHGPEPGEGQEHRSAPEEPLPPPPQSPSPEMQEPPPQLPQPQHPL